MLNYYRNNWSSSISSSEFEALTDMYRKLDTIKACALEYLALWPGALNNLYDAGSYDDEKNDMLAETLEMISSFSSLNSKVKKKKIIGERMFGTLKIFASMYKNYKNTYTP